VTVERLSCGGRLHSFSGRTQRHLRPAADACARVCFPAGAARCRWARRSATPSRRSDQASHARSLGGPMIHVPPASQQIAAEMHYPPQQIAERMQSVGDPGVPPQQIAERMQSVGDPGVPPQQIAERMQSAGGPGVGSPDLPKLWVPRDTQCIMLERR
jgi:hypothetical protein